MPSVAEIKAELKRLKIKGITGKKKAELLAMLPADSCMRAVAPKRRKAPARSPSPEPVPVKAPAPRKVAARAVVAPARAALRTIEKPTIKSEGLERRIEAAVPEYKAPAAVGGAGEKPKRAKKSTTTSIERSDLSEKNKDDFIKLVNELHPTSIYKLYDDYNRLKLPSYDKSEIEYKLSEIEGILLSRNSANKEEKAKIRTYFKNVMKKVNKKLEDYRPAAVVGESAISRAKIISNQELHNIIHEADSEKPKVKSGARRSKVDSLAKYLRGYSDQAYQDYEDSRGVEVIYPTRDVVDIITRAYNNEPFEQIVAGVGYNEEETATMIYDHFMGRGNKKYVDEDIVMRTMPEREDD